MKRIVIIISAAICLVACGGKNDRQLATQQVEKARALVVDGQLNQAKIELDSVHVQFPKEVAVRRLAKALQDSITYLEAQRNLAFADSLLQVTLPKVDPLLKKFNYEKNAKYEDHGRYVHKLLNTDTNSQRCFLQAEVTDNRTTLLKSYYYGASAINQSTLELSAGEDLGQYTGICHSFQVEGYHSILSFENDKALEVLNFISSNANARIRVKLLGTNSKGGAANYVYYLTDNEKKALEETYQLGFLFSDIKRLEDMIRLSNLQIGRYEEKTFGTPFTDSIP